MNSKKHTSTNHVLVPSKNAGVHAMKGHVVVTINLLQLSSCQDRIGLVL